MAIKTYAEQLESVQNAIATIEASPNASVTIVNRTFTKQNLEVLYAREKWLRSMAASEARGGRLMNSVIPI
jgi:hypothetical protein